MKVIELLNKISKRDKSIRNLRFEFLGQKYFIEDFKIYDVNEYGFRNQLRNIVICFLNENIDVIKDNENGGVK